MRLKGSAAVVCSLLCTAAPLHAQVPVDSVIPLDSLQVPVTRTSVSAARAPVSLSLIGRERIQGARATIGLHEALAGVPGLIIDNRQNFSLGNRVVIRGLGARAAFGVRGVRVLVDGIPLTMPDGQTNLNNLDLGSAGSIHILRGPASALFGNAAGGVIAIETEPAPGPRSAEARVTVGDQGRGSLTRLWKAQAKVAETIGAFDYLASVSRMETDGYRDYGRAEQTLLNTRAGLQAGDATRITLVLNAVDMPVAENPGSLPLDSALATPTMAWPRNVATGSGESMRQAQIGVRLHHERSHSRTDISVHALRRSLENPLPFAVIDLGRTAGGVRALYEHGLGRVTVTAGVDAEAQSDDRLEFANEGGSPTGAPRRDQEDRVASIGPFAQARVSAGPAGVSLGARYDAVRFETIDRRADVDESGERTLHAPSFMVGATLDLGAAILFANVASAFQTPTTTELLNAPPAPGQPCCPGGFNTELEPQRVISRELGLRGSVSPRVSYEAAAYIMDVRDALVQFQVPEAEGREFFRNAGRTRHRGIELAANAAIMRDVSLSGAYTFTDVRFRDDGSTETSYEDNRVPGITPHRVFAAATWSPRASSITLELHHNGSQPADDANTAENPGYTLLDLRARTSFATGMIDIAPFVALNNLLDRSYFGSLTVNAFGSRFYEPAPGFNVTLGASIRTGAWRR
ncbi:MAG TPA: TonB-dependent receptor [Longimicrobiales bacterium]|nr:TonB-dependent receptor [Longimicrobiales bacterium]